jgi:hypothetical protein
MGLAFISLLARYLDQVWLLGSSAINIARSLHAGLVFSTYTAGTAAMGLALHLVSGGSKVHCEHLDVVMCAAALARRPALRMSACDSTGNMRAPPLTA